MITVNGEPHSLPQPPTVAALLDAMGIAPDRRGIAVAVDAEVLHRQAWTTYELRTGERVEILTAMQGG